MKKQLLSVIALGAVVFLGKAQIADEWGHLKHSWDFENSDAADYKGIADGEVPDVALPYVQFSDGNVVLTNNAANSDGGYIELPAADIAINTYDAFSMECWITPTPDGNIVGHTMLFYAGGQTDATPSIGQFYFFFTPSKLDIYQIRGALNAYETWNEDGVQQDGGGLESDGTMYHCVVTVDADSLKLFVDAKRIGSVVLKADNEITNLSNDFAYIGRGGYGGDWTWEGTLHKLSLYDIALSEEEISWLYNHEDKDKHQPTDPNVGIGKNFSFKPDIYVSNGGLYIKGIDEIQVKNVNVYNITGSMLYGTNNFNNGMYMNLSSGIYIIEVKNNENTFYQKIRMD